MDLGPFAISAVLSFGGITFGWYLGAQTARKAAREEREWAERQTVRERQEVEAAKFDHAVFEAINQVPLGVIPQAKATELCRAAQTALREAWSRALILADEDIAQRVDALQSGLAIGANSPPDADGTVNLYALNVAVQDLRFALGAFQRREAPPPTRFPSPKELVALAHPHGRSVGLKRVFDWIEEREEARAPLGDRA